MTGKKLGWWPSWPSNAVCSWWDSQLSSLSCLVLNCLYPLSFSLWPSGSLVLPVGVLLAFRGSVPLLPSPICTGMQMSISTLYCTVGEVPGVSSTSQHYAFQPAACQQEYFDFVYNDVELETFPSDRNEPMVDLQVPFKFKKSSGWEIILDTWFTCHLSTWIILLLSPTLV